MSSTLSASTLLIVPLAPLAGSLLAGFFGTALGGNVARGADGLLDGAARDCLRGDGGAFAGSAGKEPGPHDQDADGDQGQNEEQDAPNQ